MYHYTDEHGLFGMVEGGQLWASSMGYLNDASEGNYALNVFSSIIKDQCQGERGVYWRKVRRSFNKSMASWDRNSIFTICFSLQGDQLSQWRGYASDGFGYSVGFDGSEENLATEERFIPINVLYSQSDHNCFCEGLVLNAPAKFMSRMQSSNLPGYEGLEQVFDLKDPDLVGALLATVLKHTAPALKDPSFSEEQEFRLYKEVSPTVWDSYVKYRVRKGLVIPYVPLTFRRGKLPVREIIVGSNLDYSKARWSLECFLKSHGYENVEIKKSNIPYLS